MFLLEWSANDLLMMALAAVVMSGLVLWLVPGAKVARKADFTESEIHAYDREIPRYFLAAALALSIGGVHLVVKNLPGFWLWLWEAGYGGHLFRDLANSHIIIVGGGTVLLSGITWYVLPRVLRRPLYSTAMASASLWFTVLGVFGFYVAWLVLGLVEGSMVRHGMDYMAAKEAMGAWHRVPTRLTSSIMGVGYWTYVLNVILTVYAARHVRSKPYGYLVKAFVVSATALLVGTVQGVLQVLPANADWIHYAGKYGQYVDPISHAHVNLVTGMMVSLSAFLIFFSTRLGGKPIGRSAANLLFWFLAGGSLVFYAAFLLLGLILGNAVNGGGGLHLPALVPVLGRWRAVILAVAGSLMLAGFGTYFVLLWRSLATRGSWRRLPQASPASFWLASSLALAVGTFQGLLQVIPVTAHILTLPEEIPNIHAQLNMIGGVLLALIGLVYLLMPELTGRVVERRSSQLSLAGIGGGIAAYYLAVLGTGIARWSYMQQGMDVLESATRLRWIASGLLTASSLPILVGFMAFAVGVFRATQKYRAEAVAELRQAPLRYSGPVPARLARAAPLRILFVEFLGGLFGWPGAGWMYAGHAMPGIALLLVGPAAAWALLPMLFSPFTGTFLSRWGWGVMLVWLPTIAASSTLALAFALYKQDRLWWRTPSVSDPRRSVDAKASVNTRIRVPRPLIAGSLLILLVLISTPLIPLVMGTPSETNNQLLMTSLPNRASGAYLELNDGSRKGIMKLFAWSFPVTDVPEETPSLNPSHVRSMLISQKGLDEPERYHLYRLGKDDHAEAIPLISEEIAFQRELRLTPASSLGAGSYLLDIPIGGMFAGREYYYFRVDPSVTTLPAIATSGKLHDNEQSETGAQTTAHGSRVRSWLVIFPLLSTLLAGLMAAVMARRLRDRVRPHEAAWTVAFAMFAVAAGSEVLGEIVGWSGLLARTYYACGATLVVGWLGLGTLLLLVHKEAVRRASVWVMLLVSGFAAGLIMLAEVDPEAVISTGWHALDKPMSLIILTIALNSIGTLLLVGGALWSAWWFWREGGHRSRMIGCALLAVGAMTVAAGGSLTRFGHDQYLYVAMSAGIALMYYGYLKTIKPDTLPEKDTGQTSRLMPIPSKA